MRNKYITVDVQKVNQTPEFDLLEMFNAINSICINTGTIITHLHRLIKWNQNINDAEIRKILDEINNLSLNEHKMKEISERIFRKLPHKELDYFLE